MGYDMGSVHSDLSLLEDAPSLSEVVLATGPAPRQSPGAFLNARPANPAMAALTSQRRETHNRSPISFREGRRASDTSLTQGPPPTPYTAATVHCALHWFPLPLPTLFLSLTVTPPISQREPRFLLYRVDPWESISRSCFLPLFPSP